MVETRMLNVFLCHSREDKSKVRELYRRLIADGFDAWFDEEKLLPGQEWDLEIRQAVRKADVVVVCLSNKSISKAGYVQKELRIALDIADEQPEGTVFIIPAKLEECMVPSRLCKWQWVDLSDEVGYKRLQHSLTLRADKMGILVVHSLNSQGKQYLNSLEPQVVGIPSGEFLMGSSDEQVQRTLKEGGNRNWIIFEQPQHILELPAYYIGKYPITNLQYRAFVQEGGTPPEIWEGDQYPLNMDAHPAANISWENATEYCIWLSRKTKKPYRLPTEAEWEKAARGEDGRIWPWGNEFGRENANTAEMQIGNTTSVGQFSPQGDSPYQCVDMIGNVWEWTNSLWGTDCWNPSFKYPYDPDDGREDMTADKSVLRILRGGSVRDLRKYARCACRGRQALGDSVRYYGFRVVFSSPNLIAEK